MILDIVEHSGQFAIDGYWSGTEERHHQPYVAMIPASRYREADEVAKVGDKVAAPKKKLKPKTERKAIIYEPPPIVRPVYRDVDFDSDVTIKRVGVPMVDLRKALEKHPRLPRGYVLVRAFDGQWVRAYL